MVNKKWSTNKVKIKMVNKKNGKKMVNKKNGQ